MTQLAVEGLAAERESFIEVLRTLDDDEWAAVRDVVEHVASTHYRAIAPQRDEWPVDDLLNDFETYTGKSLTVFASLQQPPRADRLIDMAQFGTHTTDRLADLYLFDMYTHLRADVLAPYGPVDRPEPPRDEARLRPTVEWMVSVLPMPDAPLELVLDDRSWALGDGDAVARISSGAHDFTVWASRRRPWRDYVAIQGDDAQAVTFLDAVNIV
jgi:hypothetical protein